ncbi:hypothetical protein GF337_03680 [candidate division KSB1 bacterium]|nr:hypothetical protein [candidate division KSB1 bacterium]
MKAITRITVLVLVVGFFSAFAQNNNEETYLEMAKDGYLKSLDCMNSGVRSSAAFLIVKLKTMYPDTDVSAHVRKLKKLSETDSDLATRVHCQMAVYILQNKNASVYVDPKEYMEADKFFAKVYELNSPGNLAMN